MTMHDLQIVAPGTVVRLLDNIVCPHPSTIQRMTFAQPTPQGPALALACCTFAGTFSFKAQWGRTWWTLVLTSSGATWCLLGRSDVLLEP